MSVALPDAPVLLSGQVINTAVNTDRRSGEIQGYTLTVMTPVLGGAPGFAQVKIRPDDHAVFSPDPLDQVNIFVTQSGYDFTDDAGRRIVGVSTRFQRIATEDDLDRVASALRATAGK